MMGTLADSLQRDSDTLKNPLMLAVKSIEYLDDLVRVCRRFFFFLDKSLQVLQELLWFHPVHPV